MSGEKFRYFQDLLSVLVSKELKLRYRGSTLGIVWSLANPLAFCLVLYIALKKVLQVDIENYPLFLLSALFPWQWFSNSVNSASLLFTSNASLIKKLRFPRYALGLAIVTTDMIHFLVTIPVYAGLMLLLSGIHPHAIWIVGIPVLVIVQAAFTYGVIIIISTANAFLRDLEHLVRILLLLLFYVTPVLFPVTMVPDTLKWLLVLNPVAPIMIAWRALLVDNVLSPYLGLAIAYAIMSLLLALPVYRKMAWRLAEVV